MKLLIICSKKTALLPENLFQIKLDSRFANNKFIPHLQDKPLACNLCGKKCYWCRGDYNLDFSSSIVDIVKLPDIYPLLLDNPSDCLPDKFKNHDVAVIIGVHQDILIELPKLVKESGGKAIIVPEEGHDWVSRWTRDETIEKCLAYGLQYAFPKPFCRLSYGKFDIINSFIDEFKIGKPKLRLFVDKDDMIRKAEVIISAPCGNGYNVAKHLIGTKLGEEAKKCVAKYWHSFPCMGGMHIDPEIGDTILHIGGYLHYAALENAEIIRL